MNALHVTLNEWQSVGPGTSNPTKALLGFRWATESDRALAESLSTSGRLTLIERYDGLQISARAHVGRLQLGGLTVNVLPKVAAHDLLTLVRYAYCLRSDVQPSVHQSLAGDLLQDLLILQLLAEVRVLLERGLARAYVPRDEDLSSPRGQILFARLARQDNHTSAQLPCRHYLRDSDHVLNRAVLAGVAFARGLTRDPSLRIDLARTQALLVERVEQVPLTAELMQRAARRLDRTVTPYESVLRLVELLYLGQHLDLENDSPSRALPGFLFDMNRFFQRLLHRFLSENMVEPLRVESELPLSGMLRYVPGENPRRRQPPTPRPDYAIKCGNRVVTLLDAKYRDLWETTLPRDMLYQLSIYALSQARGSTATIVYPAAEPAARPSRIEIRDPVLGSSAGFVALQPVLLSRLVQLVANDDAQSRVERRAFAMELARLPGNYGVGRASLVRGRGAAE